MRKAPSATKIAWPSEPETNASATSIYSSFDKWDTAIGAYFAHQLPPMALIGCLHGALNRNHVNILRVDAPFGINGDLDKCIVASRAAGLHHEIRKSAFAHGRRQVRCELRGYEFGPILPTCLMARRNARSSAAQVILIV